MCFLIPKLQFYKKATGLEQCGTLGRKHVHVWNSMSFPLKVMWNTRQTPVLWTVVSELCHCMPYIDAQGAALDGFSIILTPPPVANGFGLSPYMQQSCNQKSMETVEYLRVIHSLSERCREPENLGSLKTMPLLLSRCSRVRPCATP